MKNSWIKPAAYIIFIFLVIPLSCFTGDGGSSDGDTVTPFTIREISPPDEAINFPVNENIILYFTRDTDETTKGEAIIGGGGFIDPGTCTIIFPVGSPDTVILDRNANFAAGDTLTGITVYGFKDADGNTMSIYEDPNYNFSTAP